MKRLVACLLPTEPGSVVEIEMGHDVKILRVGVGPKGPYLSGLEPIADVVFKKKRLFVIVALGMTINANDFDFIGSFITRAGELFVFEIFDKVIATPQGAKLPSH